MSEVEGTPSGSVAPSAAPVSAVIVAYGQRDLVVRLIESLRAGTAVPAEIIVVDNDSPDDTAAVIARDHPDVTLVRAGSNLGFGGGANLGVRRASEPVVAILNSDVVVADDWLPPLVAALDLPGVRIASPRLLDRAGVTVECGARIDGRGLVQVNAECPEPAGRPWPDHIRPVDHCSAACWVLRRAWFERVGGFDPVYGLGYFEDVDLCAWARARGGSVVVVPDAAVRHDGGGSFTSRQASALSRRNSRVWFARWRWLVSASRHPVMTMVGVKDPDRGGVR